MSTINLDEIENENNLNKLNKTNDLGLHLLANPKKEKNK